MTTSVFEPHIAFSTIKNERKWTDRLITKFLVEPDKLAQNPNYKSGPPMRLYKVARIEAAEATDGFRQEFEKTRKRRDFLDSAAAKGVVTRIGNLNARMELAEITIITGKTRKEIERLALETHGGNYMGEPGPFHFNNRVAGRPYGRIDHYRINKIGEPLPWNWTLISVRMAA